MTTKVSNNDVPNIFTEMKGGIAAIHGNRGIAAMIAVMSIAVFCLGFVQILSKPLILVFAGETALGMISTVSALGMIVGSLGFVFQNAQMLKNLSIFDNIILPGLVAKKESAEEIRKRAAELMKRMDIEGIKERDTREVSGGQLQRASICRAMINNPDILFLDEPTGALNSGATNQVLDILNHLNQEGMTIMTVTHDPQVAAKAKKILYIKDGQITACKEFQMGENREKELEEWLKKVSHTTN